MSLVNLIKAEQYVRNEVKDDQWDFATFMGDGVGCFVGHLRLKFHSSVVESGLGWRYYYSLSNKLQNYLFPPQSTVGNTKAYGRPLSRITRIQVCDLVTKYINYKIRQEHKWKQYEYDKFGVAVTDKRGITI